MSQDRALLCVRALEARRGFSSKDMKRNSWIWQLTCEQHNGPSAEGKCMKVAEKSPNFELLLSNEGERINKMFCLSWRVMY